MNPNGGIAWADVRAADGHPAPYNIVHWELGNEPYFGNQRYWLSDNESEALAQYIDGDHATKVPRQPLARDCDLATPATSDGTPNQHVRIWYPPVRDAAVQVAGARWTRVADITKAAANDRAYQLDERTGEVRFGDGAHGRIPPTGAALTASYTLDHAGFPQFVAAMKEVDPSIDVCSAWGTVKKPTAFATAMDKRHLRYDCIAAHAYTIMHTSAPTKPDFYRTSMASEDEVGDSLAQMVAAAGASPGHPYVELTEGGEISSEDQPVDKFEATQMHAVYMASIATRVLDLGIPLAQIGDLTSHGLRSLVSRTGGQYVTNGYAPVIAMASQIAQAGGHVVAHHLDPQLQAGTAGARFDALRVATTIDAAGRLELLLVNRDFERPITVAVDGFAAGAGRAVTLAADPFVFNDAADPDGIVAISAHLAAGRATVYTIAPHAVMWIRLAPAQAAGL
jgi:alpha-N-arabinofuranosidase